MNKLVYSVFKAIMISIIFVFIFDMASYLYRAVSLNARMESLSTSLKKVVTENNYLPPEDAELYEKLFAQMINDFNSNPSEPFICGFHWNFGHSAVKSNGSPMTAGSSTGILSLKGTVYSKVGSNWQSSQRYIVETDMSKPREYGDIQVVQLRVGVYQPLWGWSSSGSPTDTDYNYSGENAQAWNVNRNARSTEFTYTYYVPCMKYKTTNTY